MQYELDNLWGSITMEAPTNLKRLNASLIHNPAITYFQMVLAHTFFGKSDNNDIVSKEELFIMLCVFKFGPVHYDAFLLVNLDTIAKSTRGIIFFSGIVTSIALVVGLQIKWHI